LVSGEIGFLIFFLGTALAGFGSGAGSCIGLVYFLQPSLFVCVDDVYRYMLDMYLISSDWKLYIGFQL